jgi:hypothetical protein
MVISQAEQDAEAVEQAERRARKQLRRLNESARESSSDVFERLGMPKDAAKLAADWK